MQLEHQFTVEAPVDVVWQALLDPERVAPCMPGATLTSVEGTAFAGSVKVKLGPISLLYKGKGEFTDTDTDSRTVKIKASGKDARSGTAAADVTVVLSEKDGQTTGAVTTDLTITGKPAQFGRGMIAEVGGKILDTFARNLAEVVTPPEKAPEDVSDKEDQPAASQPVPEPLRVVPDPQETEAIDLFQYAGSPVLKRVLPLVVVALIVFFLVARRRGR